MHIKNMRNAYKSEFYKMFCLTRMNKCAGNRGNNNNNVYYNIHKLRHL